MTNIPDVSSRYGAPMGRPSFVTDPDAPATKVALYRVYLDSGGYDNGGAYWGIGDPMYRALASDGTLDIYCRAKSRDAAKNYVRKLYPNAMFHR